MNNKQKAQLNQGKELNKLNSDYPVLAEDANYMAIVTPMLTLYSEVSDLAPQQEESSKQETEQKQISKVSLEENCLRITDLMVSYGYLKEFAPFKTIANCSKSCLAGFSAIDLIIHSQYLRNLIDEHQQESTDAGVSPELKQNLVDSTADFQSKQNDPKDFISQHKAITNQIDVKLERFQELLDFSLNRYMRSKYEKANPELYNAYRVAVDLDLSKGKVHALKGVFTDSVTGEPVKSVLISIDGGKAVMHAKQSGKYFIPSLNSGEHEFTFSRKPYQTVVRNVLTYPDKCIEMNIEFTPIEIEEAVLDSDD